MTRHVVTALIVLALVAGIAFPIRYHLTAPWRSSPAGRHLMGFTVVFDLLLLRLLYNRLVGFHGVFRWLDVLLALAIAYLPWRRWWLFERAQHDARRDEKGVV